MPCCKSKRFEYYRDKDWEPPRDLIVPLPHTIQYAFPAASHYASPGYQAYQPMAGYYPLPSYHLPAGYQALQNFQQLMATSSHPSLPMLPAPLALTPAPATVQVPQAPHYYSHNPGYGGFLAPRY